MAVRGKAEVEPTKEVTILSLPVERSEQGVRPLIEMVLAQLKLQHLCENVAFTPNGSPDAFTIWDMGVTEALHFTNALAKIAIFEVSQSQVRSDGQRSIVDVQISPKVWRAQKDSPAFQVTSAQPSIR